MIDASTLANLASYAGQLPTLTEGTRRPDPDALRTVFTLDAPLPPYEPTRLDLFARGTDPVLTGVRDTVDAVAGHLGTPARRPSGCRPRSADSAS